MVSITGKKTFGAGRFFGINNVSNPTPSRALVPQDMSIDFKRSVKELYGDKAFAAAVAGGEMSVSGKVTMGATNARIFSDLLWGDGSTTGTIVQIDKEAGTIPGSSTYIVTVANSTNWTVDLGVINATTNKPMQCVASAPATGQYSVAAGVYTFASADANTPVLVSYLYSVSTSGENVALTNPLQGPTGAFTAVMAFLWGSVEQDVLTLNNCVASDAGLATKLGDFTKPTFGFTAAVDDNDSLGTFAFAEAA